MRREKLNRKDAKDEIRFADPLDISRGKAKHAKVCTNRAAEKLRLTN